VVTCFTDTFLVVEPYKSFFVGVFLPLLPLPGPNSHSLMSRVTLTKDEAASTKNSEGINMQEGPPKGDLEVRKGTPKVEPEGEHALKAPLRNYPGGSRVR